MHHNDNRVKEYKCDMCEKAYFANIDLQRHIDTIHKGIKSYECHHCDKSFGRVEHRRRHMIAIHKIT